MCCRYFYDRSEETLQWIARQAEESRLVNRFREIAGRDLVCSGEISPAMVVPVLATSRAGEQRGFPMQWGYRLNDSRMIVNARSETARDKTLFFQSWQKRRCAVPAAWYYEWEHFTRPDGKKETGRKYSFRPEEGGITWLCGLYRIEDGLPRFVILTREPGEALSAIHDRMPLIVPERDVAEWIRPDGNADEIAGHALTGMLMEKAG